MALDLAAISADMQAFLEERMVATLSTRDDRGRLHVVPVAFTYDPERRLVHITTSGTSRKVRNVEGGSRGAVCQVDGRRWVTLEGTARVRRDPGTVAAAVAAFERRYRPAGENPDRVVIEIAVERGLGRA